MTMVVGAGAHAARRSPSPLGARLGISATHLSGHRWLTRLDLRTIGEVHVLEAPADELLPSEWAAVQRARESYVHMWGAGSGTYAVGRDPFDGRDGDARDYRVTHYITTVRTPGRPDKTVTMRRVAPRTTPGRPAPPPLQDLDLWEVATIDGEVVPLSDALGAALSRSAVGHPPLPDVSASLTSLSRSGTCPYERDPERGIDDRNRTAIAFALMQWAALQRDTRSVRYVGTLCAEFRTNAFALHLPDGGTVELGWTASADALGLDPARAVVRLDRSKTVVRDLLLSFPGFWLDNEDLGRVLGDLVERRIVRAVDLRPAVRALLSSDDSARLSPARRGGLQAMLGGPVPTPEQVVDTVRGLALPRFAKYLGPLIRRPDIAAEVLTRVGDGPYSGCLEPAAYRATVVHLLQEAQRLYGCSAGPR